MLMPTQPRRFTGTIIGWPSASGALAAVQQAEKRVNGKLDRQYLYSPRVIIHPVLASAGKNILAVVRPSQAISPGQTVIYTTGYADPNQPCHYLPNIVVKIGGH